LYRLALALKKSQVELSGEVLSGHCLDLTVKFDQHQVLCVQKLLAQFPHQLQPSEEEGIIMGRGNFKTRMMKQENQIALVNILLYERTPHCGLWTPLK